MRAQDLEREFAARAAPYAGGLLILMPADAIELVRRAEAERIPILGVDGFLITPGRVLSPVQHIADFSGALECGKGCWGDAVAHIEERRSLGLAFEIVLGDPLARGA